jgi:predicted ATPase
VSIPSGTVTFLFSDVVGSTRLWAADTDAMSASLRIHDQIFTDIIAKFEGHVFATAGDSFAAAFARASSALDCAESIQHALADVDWGTWPALTVRIGLHVGEAEERDDNYYGPTVNQAARVMAVAHGGQCVLTEGVKNAARVTVTDLGVHTLRDIETPVHLSQLGTEEFPPLWTVGTGIVSLPSPRTSLVGREESVDEVRRLVGAHRLVTLTGVGGCGKTRLSIEVAHREVPSHPDGVWFVDLSTIADEVALPGAFATALKLTVSAGAEPTEEIATYLASRQALLVVDNCEHVVDAAAEFIDTLLERSPRLVVLATSRESLEVDGEFTWKVPSLAIGTDAPAVHLFVDRAHAVGADLPQNETTRAAVADIVERLDGIPLAIELAAARTRSMDVAEVAAHLDDRFRLLSGGTRRSRQRQATLEAAVQWSWDLLSGVEQSMLHTLSVFQGGFSIPDAAAVAGVPQHEATNLIDGLVSKSLVDIIRDSTGALRHRLLETIRLFALARLIDTGEATATRDRHLDHFANDPIGASLEAWTSVDAVVRAGREYENIRSAITWALETDRRDAVMRLAAIVSDAAQTRGEIGLAIDCLRLPVELEPRDLVFARGVLGWMLTIQGDIASAEVALREAIDVGERHPTDFTVFALLAEGARVSIFRDYAQVEEYYRSAQSQADKLYGLNVQALAAMFMETLLVALLRFQETIDLSDRIIRDNPDFGYRHVVEAWRAWALLHTGAIDEAARAVAEFCPVPAGSQWFAMNLIVSHAVQGHVDGPDVARRALAAVASEMAFRRPQIASDVLQCFAYLADIGGDPARADEIVSLTTPFAGGALASWLILKRLGATIDTAHQLASKYAKDHSALEQYALDAANSPRLLAEELARWS